MTKPISPTLHGVVDYLSVAVLLVLPRMLGIEGTPIEITSTAAGVAFAYSALTRYRLGIIKMISLPGHRMIDIVFAVVFVLAPWLFGFSDSLVARNIFVGFGLFAMIIVALTDFNPERSRTA